MKNYKKLFRCILVLFLLITLVYPVHALEDAPERFHRLGSPLSPEFMNGTWDVNMGLKNFESNIDDEEGSREAVFAVREIYDGSMDISLIESAEDNFDVFNIHDSMQVQIGYTGKIITKTETYEIDTEMESGEITVTYSGDLYITSHNRYILRVNVDYARELINNVPYLEGWNFDLGKGDPINEYYTYQYVFTKEFENRELPEDNDLLDHIKKGWSWIKSKVAGETFDVEPGGGYGAGVRG